MGKRNTSRRNRRKGGRKMAIVMNIQDYKKNKASGIHKISLLDMINNPAKRVMYYKYIDENYTESEDERDIFREMTTRRKRRSE